MSKDSIPMEYCIICGKPIINRRVYAKTCSDECSKKLHEISMKKYYCSHKEDFRNYRLTHKEYFKTRGKVYREKNKSYLLEKYRNYRNLHKDEINAKNRLRHKENRPEKFCVVCGQKIMNLRQGGPKTCSEECHKIRQRELRKNKPKNFITRLCIICNKQFNKESFGKHLQSLGGIKTCSEKCAKQLNNQTLSKNKKKYQSKLKFYVLQHYSNGTPKCACCGETHFEFLTIDEIFGNKHPHLHKHFYRWIIDNNYPENFQILCVECNWLKGVNKTRFCSAHHPELYITSQELTYQKEKDITLEHYSTPVTQCACCGETNKRLLTIDHIHGDGKQHRQKIGKNIYRWIIQNNFPEGFQILCMNCNFIKGVQDKPFCKVHHPELYEIHS